MKRIICKDDAKELLEIREELLAGRPVEVTNDYETVYGFCFDSWLRRGLHDIDCTIVVLNSNPWYNYPWTYLVTLNQLAC